MSLKKIIQWGIIGAGIIGGCELHGSVDYPKPYTKEYTNLVGTAVYVLPKYKFSLYSRRGDLKYIADKSDYSNWVGAEARPESLPKPSVDLRDYKGIDEAKQDNSEMEIMKDEQGLVKEILQKKDDFNPRGLSFSELSLATGWNSLILAGLVWALGRAKRYPN